MKKTAIVTGANGFIGKNVVIELLKKDYFVYAVVSDKKQLASINDTRLTIISLLFDRYYELLELIKEESIDILIHCAWQGVWGKAFEDYELQMRNAVYAGKTMDIAAKLHTKKFVLLSTANVLETKKVITNSFEYKKLRFTTNYAMAKIASEMICRTLSCNNGVAFNCAYISMVYGEENYSMMVPNVVISKLLKGESPDLIEGNGLYDLVYVKDVASGLVAIAEKGVSMKSYYIGSRRLKTFKELFTNVGKILAPTVKMNFGVYHDANYIDYSLINLDELYDDTGFEIKTNFDESIVNTAKWVKENLL